MAWRALLILLASMPVWLGAVARQDSASESRLHAAGVPALAQRDACGATGKPSCGCGGQCAMPACGCELKPAAPVPIEDAPAVPAGRDSKPTILAMPGVQRGFVSMPHRIRLAGAVRGVQGPFWSYDSVQSFLCVWRS